MKSPKKQIYLSQSEASTHKWAQKIAQTIKKDLGKKTGLRLICLYGELGSGKTIFTKGFAETFGIDPKKVKSPTYTLVRNYQLKNHQLCHFDFYRLHTVDHLTKAELQSIFEEPNQILIIEWPERIKTLLPAKRIDIHFEIIDSSTRRLHLQHMT